MDCRRPNNQNSPSPYPLKIQERQKIEWSATGSWSTDVSNRKYSHIIASGGTGPGKASVQFEGSYTPDPEFNGQSFSIKTIYAKCIIIRNDLGGNPSISSGSIDGILDKVNITWGQAGVRFIRNGAVSYIDETDYQDDLTNQELQDMVGSYNVSDDEVEIYFVPTINSQALGVDANGSGAYNGLAVSCSSGDPDTITNILAHELGHALLLEDIYTQESGWTPGPNHSAVDYSRHNRENSG